MFYIKKIVSQFFMPLPVIVVLLLAGVLILWFTRRKELGRWLTTIGLGLLILLSMNFLTNRMLGILERQNQPAAIQLTDKTVPDSLRTIRFVVVLGGGHLLKPGTPITTVINGPSMARLIEGIRIHRRLPESKLIVSGGIAYDTMPEADLLAALARDLGVADSNIVLEPKSRDTHDEAVFLKPLLQTQPFYLVTSAQHMPRSLALFRKLGMQPIAAPTDFNSYDANRFPFPTPQNLVKATAAIHEYIGLLWGRLRGML
jgi:uncharacterized SAM-binding protein YcdF (DUF218 family)